MDEPLIEDEKPFEAEGMAEEEILPDPDEQLLLHQGNGRVWLVKVSPQPCRPYYDSLYHSLAGPKTPHGALVRYRCRGRTSGFNTSLQRS
jgi:hypothetical protein